MYHRTLLPVLLLVACANKSPDSAPPVDPEPAAEAAPEPAAEPAEPAAEPEPAAKPEPAAASKDVLGVIEGQANAKTFAELLAASPELSKQLHSMDGAGFTLLVPTDEAFAKLPKGTLERWKKNQDELERVIKSHIVPGTHDVGKLGNFRTAPTAQGKDVEVKVQESDVLVGGAKLLENDFKASNGYVHMIDKVLAVKK